MAEKQNDTPENPDYNPQTYNKRARYFACAAQIIASVNMLRAIVQLQWWDVLLSFAVACLAAAVTAALAYTALSRPAR